MNRSAANRMVGAARAACGVGVFVLCTAAAQEPQGIDYFERYIRPVLVERCYECHSAGSAVVKGGLLLDSEAGMLKGGASGLPAVVPGNPDQSRLIEAIRYANADLRMPPKGQLDEAVVESFVAWIRMGAPDPRTQTRAETRPADPEQLWALQPVRNPTPPDVRGIEWVKSPIDAFVLAKLEAKGLAPAPPADKRTLIRRATFDLTGLPPTPEEVDAFLADDDPEAFARVVDRLLASPHYGERWGRHWLDVARYADTKGYVYGDREESRFVHSHVYRDWVIRALNEDMPYDRFLMLQIAADRLVIDENKADLAAMGFLTLGRRFLGVMHDIIDDRIDTLMRGTQALTVACARCHDHKFDPIPTDDYYSLYGVFAGSSERTVELAATVDETEQFKAYREKYRARVEEFQQRFDRKAAELSSRLRAQARDYLVAVLDADKLPTEDFYEIRQADELNPTIVRRWQAYLAKRGDDDPVFGPWRAFSKLSAEEFHTGAAQFVETAFPKDAKTPENAQESMPKYNKRVAEAFRDKPPASMKEVAETYGALLLRVRDQWRDLLEQHAGKGLPQPEGLPDADDEALRKVIYADDSPVTVPPGAIVDLEWYFDEPTRVELGKLQRAVDQVIVEEAGATPHAVILEDRPQQRNAHVFKRGNPANRGNEVPRQYLAALEGSQRRPFETGSGRLELARAIASKDNPLTARVMVNRVWQHHFGQGIVRTPSDFGARSDAPSHPELLDWLAAYFVDNNWSLKSLHRAIMLSNTYRQSSENPSADGETLDPENRLLWRFNRQRLDFEAMRDAVLAAAGTLDKTMGGRAADITTPPFSTRRTVYGYVDRQFLPAVFRVFDFPNPDMHSPQRYDTTVPQQSLFLMNSPFLMEQARALGKRFADAPADRRIQAIYRTVFVREPSEEELRQGLVFVASVPPAPVEEAAPARPSAWQYGYGQYDASAQRMSFTPLPHFTGDAWQGGTDYPDGRLGWLKLTAESGHPGNDMEHAVVRRWVSPISGAVAISGVVRHETPAGNGIAARIISSRHGLLGEWSLHNSTADANVEGVVVEPGDTIDFVVDIANELNSDDFRWAPVLLRSTPAPAEAGADYETEWNAAKDFAGPPESRPVPLDGWGQYAQVLLLSNEFAFVD